MSIKHTIVHNYHAQALAGLLVVDGIVVTLVDPRRASAAWLIVGFMLLGLTVLVLCTVLAKGLRLYGVGAELIGKRVLRYVAIAVIALIGLQSIGQLTVRDVAAVLPLAAMIYLYFGYGKAKTSSS